MGSVGRNRQSMTVPPFAHVDRFDGRVFICKVEDGMKRRKAIGYMTDSTPGKQMMVPNNYFRDTYKELYSTSYPDEKTPFHEMSVGMYAATLGVGTKTGLYSDLQDNYGDVPKNKGCRPKGKTNFKPRKPRSDKGKPRGKRKQN